MQERIFQIQLKNNQTIELKFTSIGQTNDQLWQMFATTEALDTLHQLIDRADLTQTKSSRKVAPNLISSPVEKTPTKKKNK
jgi:hypothetical protein